MAKKQKYTISLTKEQRSELGRIIRSESNSVSNETKTRAKAILHLDESLGNPLAPEAAAKKAKLHTQSVYDLRKRFVLEGFDVTIYRKKRGTPPVAPKITGDVEAHIIAAACSQPPQGRTSWTMQLIADKVILDGIIDSVSDEAVRLLLKKRNLNHI